MTLLARILIALIAVFHIYYLILEMFLWDKPQGLETFGHTLENASTSKKFAMNQGLYNGFLASATSCNPTTLEIEDVLIEAARIPHSGWPTLGLDVENISLRVAFNEATTVLQMGYADPNDIHLKMNAAYWDKTHAQIAFPPYWFFSSATS